MSKNRIPENDGTIWSTLRTWGAIVAGRNVWSRVLISFGLAIAMWVYVVNADNPDMSHTFTNIPVQVRGLATDSIVGNQLQNVSVEITANRVRLETLTEGSLVAYVDVGDLGPGVHKIPVTVEPPFGVSAAQVIPDTIQVEIESRAEKTVPVEVKIIDSPPFGYELKAPQYRPTEVTVTGPHRLVDSVQKALVSISVQGRQSSINGTQKPVAVDSAGNPVDGVTLQPASVSIVLPIELQFGYKAVSVKPTIIGETAAGSFMSAIKVQPETITIVGEPDTLAGIDFLTTQVVDVSGAAATIEKQVELVLPSGVSLYKSEPVTVTVSVTQIQTEMTLSVVPEVTGLREGHSAVLSPNAVSVTVTGSPSALQNLQPSAIEAVIDASSYSEGTYRITPKITVPREVIISSSAPAEIELTIISNPPTTTPTGEQTPAPGSSPQQ